MDQLAAARQEANLQTWLTLIRRANEAFRLAMIADQCREYLQDAPIIAADYRVEGRCLYRAAGLYASAVAPYKPKTLQP